jgi:hypothetical protein
MEPRPSAVERAYVPQRKTEVDRLLENLQERFDEANMPYFSELAPEEIPKEAYDAVKNCIGLIPI